jgi:hypothetical protein
MVITSAASLSNKTVFQAFDLPLSVSIFVIGVDPGKKLKKTIQHVVKLFNTFSNYSTRFNKLFSIEFSFNTVHNYSTPHSTHYSTPHSTLYSTLNKTVNSDPNGRKPLLNRIYRNFLQTQNYE